MTSIIIRFDAQFAIELEDAIELPVIKKIHFVAETILGNSAICYTTFAMVYYPSPSFLVTLGLQIPNTKNNAFALVFELTFIP